MRELIENEHDLKLRCVIDVITGCWRWRGAKINGTARAWMFDYEKGKLAVVSGPRAAALAAGKRIPKGHRAWLTCTHKDCVNPAHVITGTMAEWGAWMSENGRLYDTPARKARIVAAWLRKAPARAALAKQILAAPESVKSVELARQLDVPLHFVSKVRIGKSWAHLRGPNPFAGLGA